MPSRRSRHNPTWWVLVEMRIRRCPTISSHRPACRAWRARVLAGRFSATRSLGSCSRSSYQQRRVDWRRFHNRRPVDQKSLLFGESVSVTIQRTNRRTRRGFVEAFSLRRTAPRRWFNSTQTTPRTRRCSGAYVGGWPLVLVPPLEEESKTRSHPPT